MVLNAVPRNNREERDANGSKIHVSIRQRKEEHTLLSPAFTLQNHFSALTQNFQYSQYYTINTVMNSVRTGKAQMTVQQDGICCSSTKYHWTKTQVGHKCRGSG